MKAEDVCVRVNKTCLPQDIPGGLLSVLNLLGLPKVEEYVQVMCTHTVHV